LEALSNILKTNASVRPGFPGTEKQIKARGRRPSALIVSRCPETSVKDDARVFDIASKTIHTSLVISGYCFKALISHEIMYFKDNQRVGILSLFVVMW